MLNLNDLEKEYLELEKENFQDGKRIKFIANLGASDEIAYHYELICKDWQEDGKLNLESSFDRHGGAGLEFLFEHLAKESDQKLKIETIYLIAQCTWPQAYNSAWMGWHVRANRNFDK